MARLTVVIPTRERAATLLYTLKSLIAQDYLDCTFLVSDNYSSDNTYDVVHSISDSRLRYIRTESRLSMADNWEFALDHVDSEFVTYVGDDDGFIPHAITNAFSVIDRFGLDCLSWKKAEYCWPSHIDSRYRNFLAVQLSHLSFHKVSAKKKLRDVLNFRDGYNRLPCVYNSIVSTRKINEVKLGSTNKKFFNAISPDVYSGFALAGVIESYLASDYPYTVNGASGQSNGTSFSRDFTKAKDTPYSRFLEENSIGYDARLKIAPSVHVCVVADYLLVREFLPELTFPEINWTRYCNALVSESKNSSYRELLLESAKYTAEKIGLELRLKDDNSEPSLKEAGLEIGYKSNTLHCILDESLISDVFDACKLVHSLLPSHDSMKTYRPLRQIVYFLMDQILFETKKIIRGC